MTDKIQATAIPIELMDGLPNFHTAIGEVEAEVSGEGSQMVAMAVAVNMSAIYAKFPDGTYAMTMSDLVKAMVGSIVAHREGITNQWVINVEGTIIGPFASNDEAREASKRYEGCGATIEPLIPPDDGTGEEEAPSDPFKDGWAQGTMRCKKCGAMFGGVRFRYSCHDKVEGNWPRCCGQPTTFCDDWKPDPPDSELAPNPEESAQ